MPMRKTMIETAYYLPEFKNKYTQQELKDLIDTKTFQDFIANEKDLKIIFYLNGKEYGSFIYYNGKFSDAIFTNSNNKEKLEMKIGKRVTDKVAVLPQKKVNNALKDYFTITSGISGLTRYQSGDDLHYMLVKITDGCGNTRKAVDTLGVKDGFWDEDISNNMLLRSLTEKNIPYHEFIIRYKIIKEAIESLSEDNYILLHLWYFPHKKLEVSSAMKKRYKMFRDYKNSNNHKKYQRAWHQLSRSINALRIRIIEVQREYELL